LFVENSLISWKKIVRSKISTKERNIYKELIRKKKSKKIRRNQKKSEE
jgi:hypothetical protein